MHCCGGVEHIVTRLIDFLFEPSKPVYRAWNRKASCIDHGEEAGVARSGGNGLYCGHGMLWRES
jgi:hypothetical protein